MITNKEIKRIDDLIKKRHEDGKETTLRFLQESGDLDIIKNFNNKKYIVRILKITKYDFLPLDFNNGFEPYLDYEIMCFDEWYGFPIEPILDVYVRMQSE